MLLFGRSMANATMPVSHPAGVTPHELTKLDKLEALGIFDNPTLRWKQPCVGRYANVLINPVDFSKV